MFDGGGMGWFPPVASDGRAAHAVVQAVNACCHGQLIERCSISRLAELAMLAGTAMRVRRIVKQTAPVKTAIAAINADAWTPIA